MIRIPAKTELFLKIGSAGVEEDGLLVNFRLIERRIDGYAARNPRPRVGDPVMVEAAE